MEDHLLEALVELEQRRTELHAALRQAHFLLGTTQRSEDARGHLLGIEAFPVDENTLFSLVTLEKNRNGSRENDDDALSDEGTCWSVAFSRGQPPPSTLRSVRDGSDAGMSPTALVDPIFYVAAAPSAELRACQAAYQEVMTCVVRVTNAQTHVAHLADQLIVSH